MSDDIIDRVKKHFLTGDCADHVVLKALTELQAEVATMKLGREQDKIVLDTYHKEVLALQSWERSIRAEAAFSCARLSWSSIGMVADSHGNYLQCDDVDTVMLRLAAKLVDAKSWERSSAQLAKVFADFFNTIDIKALKEVPEKIRLEVGNALVASGYRMVFNRWYEQAEHRPIAQSQPAPLKNTSPWLCVVADCASQQVLGSGLCQVHYLSATQPLPGEPVVHFETCETCLGGGEVDDAQCPDCNGAGAVPVPLAGGQS